MKCVDAECIFAYVYIYEYLHVSNFFFPSEAIIIKFTANVGHKFPNNCYLKLWWNKWAEIIEHIYKNVWNT